MRLIFKAAVLCAFFTAACGGSMKGKLGNAACDTGCTKSQEECVEKCSTEVDKDACELACTEAKSKCESECK